MQMSISAAHQGRASYMWGLVSEEITIHASPHHNSFELVGDSRFLKSVGETALLTERVLEYVFGRPAPSWRLNNMQVGTICPLDAWLRPGAPSPPPASRTLCSPRLTVSHQNK